MRRLKGLNWGCVSLSSSLFFFFCATVSPLIESVPRGKISCAFAPRDFVAAGLRIGFRCFTDLLFVVRFENEFWNFLEVNLNRFYVGLGVSVYFTSFCGFCAAAVCVPSDLRFFWESAGLYFHVRFDCSAELHWMILLGKLGDFFSEEFFLLCCLSASLTNSFFRVSFSESDLVFWNLSNAAVLGASNSWTLFSWFFRRFRRVLAFTVPFCLEEFLSSFAFLSFSRLEG